MPHAVPDDDSPQAGPAYAGLLVDWGGVMTTDVFASFATFAEAQGLAPDAVAAVFRHDPAARELLGGLETGALAPAEFEQGLAALLGAKVDPEGLITRLMAQVRVEPLMVEAVRTAKAAGVATGLVSNSWGPGGYPRELIAQLFDGVVISGEVGVRKPRPEIYRLGADAIGVPPERCVFVDDLRGNLRPAEALGMTVIHHTSAPATVDRLTALLGTRPGQHQERAS
ncbi:HAD family phosphatase [Actinospica durhamensis]|uniref:HAD family phosphatase n=1 Tax=Actinospica durhamensis TaxID=1508375 RepID=A0A941IV91_9ACTN|nr:HAD family phosphatase [Actinospica durhamensis]MBR7838828.1 HAD family phosphatase [Actinospica durhamensis]